jgi:hypothetical protein
MLDTIFIAPRFHGPPTSANGGYACGLVAGAVGGPTECTLRAPPPLNVPLDVQRDDGNRVIVCHEQLVVAEGRPSVVELSVPDAVDFDTASAASRNYVGFKRHPYPNCFVCGPNRAQGDGLRIFPGAVPERGVAAGPWVPDPSLADETGHIRPEIVWSALDCPSWFGAGAFSSYEGSILLGRLSGQVHERPRAGERCVCMGWLLGEEGRKFQCGSALFAEDGRVLARARATWIKPHNA